MIKNDKVTFALTWIGLQGIIDKAKREGQILNGLTHKLELKKQGQKGKMQSEAWSGHTVLHQSRGLWGMREKNRQNLRSQCMMVEKDLNLR